MARFVAAVPVNLEFEGISFNGPAGTVFDLPDELVPSFFRYAQHGIPGFQWLIVDEFGDHESRIVALEGAGGGSHPGLAAHDTLGLVTEEDLDAHEIAADPHTAYALTSELSAHEGAADPHAAYQLEAEKGVANGYAGLDAGGKVPDAQIPASIARDSELPDLAGHVGAADPHTAYALDADLTAHVAAADPHTGYVREADANWIDLTDAGETTLHSHAGGGAHPDLATHDALGLATQAELDAHLNDTADAHDASAISLLDTAADFDATDVEGALAELQSDAEAHVAAGDPHAGYRLESADHTHATTGLQAGQISHANLTGVSANQHHNQAHDIDGADHTLAGEVAGEFMRATSATAFAFESVPFSRGGTVLDPTGARIVMVWRAPFACTVTAVKGHRKGGTGATVNARRNQASDHLATDLSLVTVDAWADGGAVQNTAYAAGDDLEIEIASIAGAVTEIAIQVDFTRP
jgi:hypothetical protein